MKILVVHQYYLMPGQFGGSRFNEMARFWAAQGHDVTVIAGTIDHGSGKTPKRYLRRWVTKEQDGAVTVYRCYVPGTYGTGYLGRMWGFLGFTLSSATAALCIRRPDVVIATSPPLITAIPGWIAAHCSFRTAPWIFEIRDLWPESAITTGVIGAKSLVAKILFQLERRSCRSATKINVLTPAFQEDIEKRRLATAEKIVFVPNGADTETFRPESRDNAVRRELGWGERFVAIYAGAHGRANAVHQLINAAEELRHRPDILIACFGDGTERAQVTKEAARRGLENIRFYGPRPKNEMPEIVSAGDAGIAVLQNNPTFRTVYPNKVFDYMSCARPVVVAIDGIARKLVCDQANAGIFAEPENGRAIADAIEQLACSRAKCAEFGRNGRQWVLANASRDSLAARYLLIMSELVTLQEGSNAVARKGTASS
jgi:glycosyltransferase involved in cell wall biosynthesis